MARAISRLFDGIRLSSRLMKAGPGFSSVLGFTAERLAAAEELSFDHHTFRVRLPLSSGLCWPQSDGVSLSTHLAIVDDLTSRAIVLDDPQRGRPGVSVSLDITRGPVVLRPGGMMDFTGKVNKVGRNMGFCDAEIRTADGQIVAVGSHIKYLPGGVVLDWLTSSTGWEFKKYLVERALKKPKIEELSLLTSIESLRFDSDNSATFSAQPVNRSFNGPIHGGCQAVLMERVAEEAVKRRGFQASLQSMSVQYLSPPSSSTVQITADILPMTDSLLPVHVQISGDGKIKSKGVLLFGLTSRLAKL